MRFFSFCACGGSKAAVFIKVLEKSRKGEQTPVAVRRLCLLSLCRIQGDFWAWVLSLSMAGSRYHPIIHWNTRAGTSSVLQVL